MALRSKLYCATEQVGIDEADAFGSSVPDFVTLSGRPKAQDRKPPPAELF